VPRLSTGTLRHSIQWAGLVADAGSDYKLQSVEQLGKMRQRHSALTGLGRERPHSDLVHIWRRAQHHNGIDVQLSSSIDSSTSAAYAGPRQQHCKLQPDARSPRRSILAYDGRDLSGATRLRLAKRVADVHGLE